MAAPFATSKATCHVRSISLPSRSHPQTVSIEEQFSRLRSSQAASPSICQKLNGLRVMCESVNLFLQLPQSQQYLCNEHNRKWVEEALDGYLQLLDVCGMARDGFASMKECLQDLESSLRRKRGGECPLTNEIEAYMVSRKMINKAILKSFRNLRRVNKESNMAPVVALLKEVQETSLESFESLMSYLCQPKSRSRTAGWSIVSKLLKSQQVSNLGEAKSNVVEWLDAQLLALKSNKGFDVLQFQKVSKELEALESTIHEAEEELECVYRQLVKIRVSILNVLNQ